MRANLKMLGIGVASVIAFAIGSIGMPNDANAGSKKAHPVAPPPPFGYYYGEWPVTLDRAQAQALSLARPYYTHFMYSYCDYRNCELRWNGKDWAPVWYGPAN
jgi:hypothetical protein